MKIGGGRQGDEGGGSTTGGAGRGNGGTVGGRGSSTGGAGRGIGRGGRRARGRGTARIVLTPGSRPFQVRCYRCCVVCNIFVLLDF